MNSLWLPFELLRQTASNTREPRPPVANASGGRRRDGIDQEIFLSRAGVAPLQVFVGRSGQPQEDASQIRSSRDCLWLLIGQGGSKGQLGASLWLDGGLQTIERARIIGSGFQDTFPGEHGPGPLEAAPEARWSRTIGALGQEAWQTLSGMSVAIVGLGRTGSMIASALYRIGVRRLVLIDPDRVEQHNLGEMALVGNADRGQAKVLAVARILTAESDSDESSHHRSVVAIEQSITNIEAFRAAARCDVIISSLDHDSGRLVSAAAGVLYHRPLLDVATGVLMEKGLQRIGADIRLTLPGHCLLCTGGLRNAQEARRVLSSPQEELAFFDARNWKHGGRLGSLASLNSLAASLAIRLLEDWIGGRVDASTWIHLEFDERGRLDVRYPWISRPQEACPLCALGGCGDDGVSRLPAILQAWA